MEGAVEKPEVNVDALKSEIRAAVINRKANACPMVVRLAWHSSGTFDKSDSSGGSDGARMRFAPELDDDANKGLGIVRDLLLPVKQAHPELSFADLWTLAGASACEFLGGPSVPHRFGRSDHKDGKAGAPGRLPDAAQGADHVRECFTRMGFDDKETVALIGAHTLGRCHSVRSGYDGPWTRNPLKMDNSYFKNLLFLKWKVKEWDGPKQFVDVNTEELMMLPADMALLDDPEYRKWVETYAKDEQAWFDDFSAAFAKLISLGCPEHCSPFKLERKKRTKQEEASINFREHAMHGSVGHMKMYEAEADVHSVESTSGRSALHKAAYWGHVEAVKYLLGLKLNVNLQDYNGDTPLHDAARFGHAEVCDMLLNAGADLKIKNKEGQDVPGVAKAYEKPELAASLLKKAKL